MKTFDNEAFYNTYVKQKAVWIMRDDLSSFYFFKDK